MKAIQLNEINSSTLLFTRRDRSSKTIEGILTADGTYYPVYFAHWETSLKLDKEGVDLKNALRISQMFEGCTSFSSLEKYNINEKINNDKTVKLTEAQAQAIIKYYEAVKRISDRGDILANILRRSVNLGWCLSAYTDPHIEYYDTNTAIKNLDLLQEAVVSNNLDPTSRSDLDIYSLYDEIKESNRGKISAILNTENVRFK